MHTCDKIKHCYLSDDQLCLYYLNDNHTINNNYKNPPIQ